MVRQSLVVAAVAETVTTNCAKKMPDEFKGE